VCNIESTFLCVSNSEAEPPLLHAHYHFNHCRIHYTLPIVTYCRLAEKEQVLIYFTPSNTAAKLQSVCLYRPMRKAYHLKTASPLFTQFSQHVAFGCGLVLAPLSSSSSLTRRQLGPKRRCRVTATDSLTPESRYGNVVVVTLELIGPLGTHTDDRADACRLGLRVVGRLKARLGVAVPGVPECCLVASPHDPIWHSVP